jgi:isocitrate/isopropylmalate dehydrogenase
MALVRCYPVLIMGILTNNPGPEVIAQATRILETIDAATPEISLKLESHQFGGCAIDATGEPLPPATLKACQEADAILMGRSRFRSS